VDELAAILKHMAAEEKLRLAPRTSKAAHDVLTTLSGDAGFGNARGVRNVFEQAKRRLASRVGRIESPTVKDLVTLLPGDFRQSG